MPRPLQPKGPKTEENVQKALEVIRSGEVPSAYAAEKKFGVSRVVLCRRLAGKQQAHTKAHEQKQMLTHFEEEALVK